jgi:hypothetical protein
LICGSGKGTITRIDIPTADMNERNLGNGANAVATIGGVMVFLMSHWHCIVPVLALVALLQSRGRKRTKETKE